MEVNETPKDRKAHLREEILARSTNADTAAYPDGWGRTAEKLRRIAPYKSARTILIARTPMLRQVQMNALSDRKNLIVPTPGLQKGFLLFNPEMIPPQKRNLAIRLVERNPYAAKIPYDHKPRFSIDLIITDSMAVGRDGSRLGCGEGHMDLQWAILTSLGWIPPLPVVVTLVEESSIINPIPMEETDIGVNWIITPKETFRTSFEYQPMTGVVWEKLNSKMIRRSDPLFFLHRQSS